MRFCVLSISVAIQIAATAVFVCAQPPRTAQEFYLQARQKMVTLPATLGDVEAWRRDIDADLERAVKLAPKNSTYLMAWASHLVTGHSPRAKTELDRLIRLKPNAELYSLRADWYDEKDKRILALADRTNAIRLDPKNAQLYSTRAFAYIMQQRYDKALWDYNKAVALAPKNANFLMLRAEHFEMMGRDAEAEADYTKAVEFDPKEGYRKRANFYWINKQIEKAIADQSKAIEYDPTNNATVMIRSVMYEEVKDYEKAIADMSTAISLIPKYAEYYTKRADLYRKVGKVDLASKDDATAAELKKQ